MSGAHQIIWLAPDYVYNSPSYGSRIGQSACVSSKILHVSRDVTLLALDLANDRPWVAKFAYTTPLVLKGRAREWTPLCRFPRTLQRVVHEPWTQQRCRKLHHWEGNNRWKKNNLLLVKNKKWERIARKVMKIALYCEHNDRRFTSSRELWSVVS